MNSDDVYLANAFGQVGQAFSANPQIRVLSGAHDIVNIDATELIYSKQPHNFDPRPLIRNSGGVPGQPSVFINRDVVAAIGGLDVSLDYAMDWEYWIRIGRHIRPDQVSLNTDVLSFTRIWEGMKSATGGYRGAEENLRVLDQLFAEPQSDDDGFRILRRRAYFSAYMKLARSHWKSGQYRKAIRAHFNSLRSDPINYMLRYVRRFIWRRMRRYLPNRMRSRSHPVDV